MSDASSSTDTAHEHEHARDESSDPEHAECPTCGTLIDPLLPSVNTELDLDTEKDEEATAKKEEPPKPKAATARRARAPNVKQNIVRLKAARQLVRRNMLACVPGIGLVKAKAIIDAFPTGTLLEIMNSDASTLKGLGNGRSKVTSEDAAAIKRVLQ